MGAYSDLLGLIVILAGGIVYGIRGRCDKDRDHWPYFWLAAISASVTGGGFLWHGHTNVHDIWSLLLSLVFAFMAFGLGYSVTRPR